MFDCDVCGTTLVDDDDSDEIKQSQEQLGRLVPFLVLRLQLGLQHWLHFAELCFL